MILLAAIIIVFLLVATCAIGGPGNLATLYDLPALLAVLALTTGFVLVCGYEKFRMGLSAILRRPSQSQADISHYFQKLTGWLLGSGTVLALALSVFCMYIGDLEVRKQMLTTAILIFSYSAWLSLALFMPIAFRFSGGDSGIILRNLLAIVALLGICFFAPVLIVTASFERIEGANLVTGVLEQLKELIGPFAVFLLWDLPSLLVVLLTITACRLGMGKLQNRYNWIPICILIGVLWTLQGVSLMLTDLDPRTFFSGWQVSLVTTFYAGICVLAVIVNRSWFFTIAGVVFAICILSTIVLNNLILNNPPSVLENLGLFVCYVVSLPVVGCALGRICDLLYLFTTRYESFDELFKKHKIESFALLVPFSLLMLALVPMLIVSSFFAPPRINANVQCPENLRQIGIALQNYQEQHGSFPPAYTVDADGKPLHSWRTLILPYFNLEAIDPKWKEIYEQIRLDEPWDSEHNERFHYSVLKDMPAVYGCHLCCSGARTGETLYKMIVGDNAIGSVQEGTPLSQITRPLGEVAAVVEAAWQVQWMSPRDFAVENFRTAVYANDLKKVSEIIMNRSKIASETTRNYRVALDNAPSEEAKRDALAKLIAEIKQAKPAADAAADKAQILGAKHSRQLHLLFADGTVKIYGNFDLPISEIEAMSRLR